MPSQKADIALFLADLETRLQPVVAVAVAVAVAVVYFKASEV